MRVVSLLVQGRLRDTQEPFDSAVSLRLNVSGDQLNAVDVTCAEEDLARIARARRQPVRVRRRADERFYETMLIEHT